MSEVFIPSAQSTTPFFFLIARSGLDTPRLTDAVRRAIRSAAPQLPLRAHRSATPLSELISASLAVPRFLALLSSAFSATAVILAGMGVFGLVAYSVTQRRREFALRAALGAEPRDLTVRALQAALALTGFGVAGGIMTAAVMARAIEAQLYGVAPLDLVSYAGAAGVMLAIAAAAAGIPARRAARLDPAAVLRNA